jgi:hypothetical protein
LLRRVHRMRTKERDDHVDQVCSSTHT